MVASVADGAVLELVQLWSRVSERHEAVLRRHIPRHLFVRLIRLPPLLRVVSSVPVVAARHGHAAPLLDARPNNLEWTARVVVYVLVRVRQSHHWVQHQLSAQHDVVGRPLVSRREHAASHAAVIYGSRHACLQRVGIRVGRRLLVVTVAVHAHHQVVRHLHLRCQRVVLPVRFLLHLAQGDDGRARLLRKQVRQGLLVLSLAAQLLHHVAAPHVRKQPLAVVLHLHIPVRHAAPVIARFLPVRHRIKGIDGFLALAVAAVFRHVFLIVLVGAFQQVVVQRTLYHALHALHLRRQQQSVVHLAHADRRVSVSYDARPYIRRLPCRRNAHSRQQVAPVDALTTLHALP